MADHARLLLGSARWRFEWPLGRTQRPMNYRVNLPNVLVDRLWLPAPGLEGLQHLPLERSREEPEAPVR